MTSRAEKEARKDAEWTAKIQATTGGFDSPEAIAYDIPEVYTRDAFKNCVGAVVPVKIGEIVVGTAKVLDQTGQVEISFNA